MNNQELINRYIYQVVKRLPYNIKEDVSKELQGLIEDMLSENMKDEAPGLHDVEAVLTELGSPSELALKYNPGVDKCLISKKYYGTYRFVLQIVLCIVAGVGLIASLLSSMQNNEPWQIIAVNMAEELLTGLSGAFAVITVVFACIERSGLSIDITAADIHNLPPVPKNQDVIKKGDPIFSIVMLTLLTIIFLIAPQILCFITKQADGTVLMYPIFNVELVHSIWYIFVLLYISGMAKEITKLIELMHTKKLLIVTIVSDMITAVATIIWLSLPQAINPEFVPAVMPYIGNDNVKLSMILGKFNLIFIGLTLMGLIVDVVDTTIRTIKK